MQPNASSQPLLRIARKEITLFFASPVAYLFLGSFAAITLFVFFWGEAFFARNIADVRPLFEWLPLLLIFLCATLTMRQWSEERRSGTLEHVLTQAVPLWHFVIGKFLGCLFLLGLALLITLPLPITVAFLGDLDWGPVWAGYLATFLLGAAYLSIGLFVSARSDNPIVSLISASALCGCFYLIGSPVITGLFSNATAEWLTLLGTGSRFESITRGVIDFRDLYYYLSIVAVFLTLNTLILERERWISQGRRPQHRHWHFVTGLLIANALGANLWLGQITALRVDVTEGQQYSISDATRTYLEQLQEPLLIRGYFSSKTHPLLAPLVPQMRDLIREYEIAGKGRVRIEFIDPLSAPELEQEANQKYAIQPVPFQVADRYQSSIVSSYFNILVAYGNEHQVLGFRDLIEVQARSESDLNVQLRNPEHDLTRAIKKVLHSYQAGGNLFDTVKGTLTFNGYISANEKLPAQLVDFRTTMNEILAEFSSKADGRLSVSVADPEAGDGALGQHIAETYGFRPMATSLLSSDTFYYYMTLAQGDQVVQLPLDDLSEESFKRNVEAAIKRFATGFTKTVALVAPNASPYGGRGASFNRLEQFLGAELNVQREDLSDGSVSGQADLLLLLAPENLDKKALFAIDQFLMQGGTVIAATSPYSASLSSRNLNLREVDSGLQDWLAHHGLSIDKQLVLDPQNSAFPVPVTRNLGGFQIQDMRLLDYPYFPDLRAEELNQSHPMTRTLGQLTLAWASPITLDTAANGERSVTKLLHSSASAGLSTSMDIMPKLDAQGLNLLQPEKDIGRHLLGVASEGQFVSYFADQTSPLLEDNGTDTSASEGEAGVAEAEAPIIGRVISKSPASARIILFASNDFLRDQILTLAGSAAQSDYLNSLQLAANAVDWSLEDAGLMSIRSRGHFNRTLPPIDQATQELWEYANYLLAALALAVIALLAHQRKRAKTRAYQQLLTH